MKKWLFFALAIVLLASIVGVYGCKKTPEISFLEILKLVPDNPVTRSQVFINDFAKIRDIYDIPLPPSDADDDAIEEYIMMFAGDISTAHRLGEVSFLSGMGPRQYAFHSPIRRQNTGFGPQDVDLDIVAGVPPMVFEAAKGRYDPVVVKDTLNNYDEADSPHYDEYGGIAVYDWGYGGNELNLTRLLSPPFFDHLGRCRPLGVGHGYVLRAFDTDSIETMIDGSQGQLTSLADNPDFNLMVTALTEMGAHSVFLTDQVQMMSRESVLESVLESFGGVVEPERLEELNRQFGIGAEPTELVLGAYQTLATGIGKDDDGVFMAMVLVYDSSEEASSDVPVFEQRIEKGTSLWKSRHWRDLIDSQEVWSDGRTLQARLRGELVHNWLEMFFRQDSLLYRR